MRMGADFDFHYTGPENKNRVTYRVSIQDALVHIEGHAAPYALSNISASGLAFYAPDAGFNHGEELIADITGKKRGFLKGLKLEIVRVNRKEGIVACKMVDLDSDNEALIDKLVLEVQKRELARKRAGASS